MSNIINYTQKRDILGRFKTSKRTKAKILFVLLAFTSFYLNYFLARQAYNLKCSNGVYFTNKAKCDDLVTMEFDAKELYRQQFVEENQDLFNDYENNLSQ
jgi:hypothetical protein